ncbi:hypothetical protein IWQ61_003342 [Dispira simplex]|nr:hypothetical protein IWQ61_003342 [Dispira simplex]
MGDPVDNDRTGSSASTGPHHQLNNEVMRKLVQNITQPFLQDKIYNKDDALPWINELGRQVTDVLKRK